MVYQEQPPPASLRDYCEAFWTVKGPASKSSDAGTILPDGCVEVVLSCADPVLPSAGSKSKPLSRFIVGIMDRPWKVAYTGRVDLVGIRLRPAATSCFLSSPAKLANRITDLAEVRPDLDAQLDRAVRQSRRRRQAVSEALVKDAAARRPDAVISAAVEAIRAAQGCLRMDALAQSLALSERRLQRRFEREVGISPKRWARIARFQVAFEASTRASDESWTDLAGRLGYADQAHMIRDFAEFTGAAPTKAWWTERRISSRQARDDAVR